MERPERELTPHPLLVPRSWKFRAIPLLPLWAVRPVQILSACTRVHFTFIYITCGNVKPLSLPYLCVRFPIEFPWYFECQVFSFNSLPVLTHCYHTVNYNILDLCWGSYYFECWSDNCLFSLRFLWFPSVLSGKEYRRLASLNHRRTFTDSDLLTTENYFSILWEVISITYGLEMASFLFQTSDNYPPLTLRKVGIIDSSQEFLFNF